MTLSEVASCGRTARISPRVSEAANCVYVCIPAAWDTVEADVSFCASRRAWPNVNFCFPICLDSRDAVWVCGKMTIGSTRNTRPGLDEVMFSICAFPDIEDHSFFSTNAIVTYEEPPTRSAAKQMFALQVTRFATHSPS